MTKKSRMKLYSLLLSFTLISCQNQSRKISLFIYDTEDTFIASLMEKIGTKLTSLSYDYTLYDSKRSQMNQNKAIVDAIDNKKSSLLLVNLVDRLSAYTTMEKVMQKDVPVVFFNREPLENDMERALKYKDNIYYVGTNPTFEGKKQAEMVDDIFVNPMNLNPLYDHNGDNVIQMIMIKGEIGNQDTENRSLSFLNTIKEKGYQIEILDSVYCDWRRDLGYQQMSALYKKYNDKIELVVCNNDDMALGAIDSLVDDKVFDVLKENQLFPILGVDGTDAALPYLTNGLLYGTVKNDAEKQSDAIVNLAQKLLQNEGVDSSSFPYPINDFHAIYIEGEKMTKQNRKIS